MGSMGDQLKKEVKIGCNAITNNKNYNFYVLYQKTNKVFPSAILQNLNDSSVLDFFENDYLEELK